MRLTIDTTTKKAIKHTLHCLTGCGIGEVFGSAIGTELHWANPLQTLLAVILAFGFGYGLYLSRGSQHGFIGTGSSYYRLAN